MLEKVTVFSSNLGVRDVTVKKIPEVFDQLKTNAGTNLESFGVILSLIGAHEDGYPLRQPVDAVEVASFDLKRFNPPRSATSLTEPSAADLLDRLDPNVAIEITKRFPNV